MKEFVRSVIDYHIVLGVISHKHWEKRFVEIHEKHKQNTSDHSQ